MACLGGDDMTRALAIIAAARADFMANREPTGARTNEVCLLAVCAYVVVGMGLWAWKVQS